MKIQFTKEERQFIRGVLADAAYGARRAGDKRTAKQGEVLASKFMSNVKTTILGLSERSLIESLVYTAHDMIRRSQPKNKGDENELISKFELIPRIIAKLAVPISFLDGING